LPINGVLGSVERFGRLKHLSQDLTRPHVRGEQATRELSGG
jgi:hypothetical protein